MHFDFSCQQINLIQRDHVDLWGIIIIRHKIQSTALKKIWNSLFFANLFLQDDYLYRIKRNNEKKE